MRTVREPGTESGRWRGVGKADRAAAITLLHRTEDGPYGRNDDEIDSDGMVRSGISASEWTTGVTLADPPSAALEGHDGV